MVTYRNGTMQMQDQKIKYTVWYSNLVQSKIKILLLDIIKVDRTP